MAGIFASLGGLQRNWVLSIGETPSRSFAISFVKPQLCKCKPMDMPWNTWRDWASVLRKRVGDTFEQRDGNSGNQTWQAGKFPYRWRFCEWENRLHLVGNCLSRLMTGDYSVTILQSFCSHGRTYSAIAFRLAVDFWPAATRSPHVDGVKLPEFQGKFCQIIVYKILKVLL